MKHFPKDRLHTRIVCPRAGSAWLLFLVLLHACAPTGPLSSAGGELKNSLPVVERDLIEEVRTIAVPPFHEDQDNWQATVQHVLSSQRRISVVPSGKTEAAVRSFRKNLSGLPAGERPDLLTRVGRAVQADAVVNGIILRREGKQEIILQLISARDGRMLWWQAADCKVGDERPSPQEQKALVSGMLSSLLESAGKRERSVAPPPQPQSKPDRKGKPVPAPESIGPM